MAFAVQHDVAIVPVFDLQQEEEQAVGSHAADEIIARLVDTRAQAMHQDTCLFTGKDIGQNSTQLNHFFYFKLPDTLPPSPRKKERKRKKILEPMQNTNPVNIVEWLKEPKSGFLATLLFNTATLRSLSHSITQKITTAQSTRDSIVYCCE